MNNSNFGCECKNNADNCTFTPIFHEIEELSYAKKYQNIFDPNISCFASSKFSERQIEEEYRSKISSLDQHDEYSDANKNSLKIFLYEKVKTKKINEKDSIKNIEQITKDEEANPNTKTIEFDETLAYSVKCLAIKKD